ncbi:MAG TPA: SIS domain-containing protein, partial [Bacteroidota bacterium]|nr:SIS domain-containing protein [Bacteroidota bacterium]
LAKQMKQTAVVFVRDRDDHPRIALRMDITKSIIAKKSGAMVEVHSQGKSLLARTFSLVHIGDWVSFYLAMLNNVDPTPVKVIDYVKAELSKR